MDQRNLGILVTEWGAGEKAGASGLIDTAWQDPERAPGSAPHSLWPEPGRGLQSLPGPSVEKDGVSPLSLSLPGDQQQH